ncbi:adhesion G protein-coupled receptor L2-like [Diorhabda carinulata]|uniref:adhesion G protein-coupled receptor L2-like n=1 Tax=Diorhabda carinulata TaxID=1163345 RepID=UPI0025A19F69|nr:adhesion G protein-coupled receptor L2-like [Diorhabda carinulata]
MNLLLIICLFCASSCVVGTKNVSNNRKLNEDDYYLNYDYEIDNNSVNLEPNPKSLVLPNHQNLQSKYTVDVLPNVELPDDSLADPDLRDHDFIDNIMYVYYGSHTRNNGTYGPEIIIIGSVLSCAAQLLTIFCVLLKKNQRGERMMTYIFFQILGTFCISNLIFMLGVYATKSATKCLIISLILYFLHLMTSVWLCLYCFYIYKRFSSGGIIKERHLKVKYFNIAAYDIPTFLTLATYFIAPNSYESRRFCFISVQKGMILNYMFPVSLLIFLTTIHSLSGIRKINMELCKLELNSSAESLNALRNELEMLKDRKDDCLDEEIISLRESKSCLKLLCLVQTGYDIVWFIVVLALENVNESSGMAIIYAITSCLLNWYIFIKRKSLMPTLSDLPDDIEEVIVQKDQLHIVTASANVSRRGSSDSIPLLNSDTCTEMRELRLDHISTITT